MPNVRPGGIALDTATSIIWVDASAGSDANAGTFASPVKTIKKALTIATDTIAVRPGTYNAALGETFPITVQSGIKLVSTSGAASTIIDATGANSRVIHCTGNSNATLIDGFTIKGGFYQPPTDGSNATGGGIFTEGGDQTTFSRCIITGNEARGYNGNGGGFFGGGIAYGGGMGINGSTNTVINCVFSNNIARGGNGFAPATIGYPGGDAHGGGAWDGANASVFTNNTFYGNQSIGGNGANAISGTSNGGAGGSAFYGALDCQNCSAKNNIVSNNSVTGGTGGAGFGGGSNGGFGLAVTGGILVATATNNLYYSNTGGDGTTGTNPITGQNPLFVNPSGDLHLKSSSPAKYAGTSTGQPSVDLDNNPRPFGPTIGAYELGLFPVVIGGIGRVTITWSGVDGATSYNLYYAPGGVSLTTADAKIVAATSPYVFAPVLNASSWSFALTAVENGVEGPIGPSYSTSSAPVCSGPGGPWGTAAASGNSWTNLTKDLADGNTLYATATDSVGLYKSTDAGNTWTPLTGPFNGFGMHAAAANGSNVLVAGQGAIYRSTNGGSTWSTSFTGAGIGEDFINSLAIDPLNPTNVYAGDFHIDFGTTSSYLVIKSTDSGATFHNLTDASAANLRAYFLQFDPVTSGTLYAAGSGSPNIAKSTNNGSTWSSVSPVAGYPTALAQAPNLSVRQYAGMKDVDNTTVLGIYRSNNGGSSWTAINTGLGTGVVNALLVDPANADHVHAGLTDGYFVSTDGTTWSPAAAGVGSHSINAFAQTTTRRLIATTGNDRIIMLPLDPAPTISANASPGSGNPAGGDTVTITGTGFNINPATGLRVLFGGVDGLVSVPFSNSTSITVVKTPGHAPGAVDVAVINPDGQAAIRTNGYTYAAGTITLNAVASQSGTAQVNLSWTAAGGASSYDVRLLNLAGGTFSTVATVSALSYNHTGVSLAVGYVYQIVANTGAYSNLDLAVPMDYTDPSLTAGNVIKAAHFTQLRTAVNAARAAAGLSALTFTDSTLNSSVMVKRVHLIELRNGLDTVRSTLGLSAISYTDSAVTAGSTTVKAQHILDLRNGVQ